MDSVCDSNIFISELTLGKSRKVRERVINRLCLRKSKKKKKRKTGKEAENSREPLDDPVASRLRGLSRERHESSLMSLENGHLVYSGN